MRPGPTVSIFRTGGKEAIMEESKKSRKLDYRCESRCVEEFVECIETEEGASICKTRERNCFGECKL
jgi:SET domain-containing protein